MCRIRKRSGRDPKSAEPKESDHLPARNGKNLHSAYPTDSAMYVLYISLLLQHTHSLQNYQSVSESLNDARLEAESLRVSSDVHVHVCIYMYMVMESIYKWVCTLWCRGRSLNLKVL